MPRFIIDVSARDFYEMRDAFKRARNRGYASRLNDTDAGKLFMADALLEGAFAVLNRMPK